MRHVSPRRSQGATNQPCVPFIYPTLRHTAALNHATYLKLPSILVPRTAYILRTFSRPYLNIAGPSPRSSPWTSSVLPDIIGPSAHCLAPSIHIQPSNPTISNHTCQLPLWNSLYYFALILWFFANVVVGGAAAPRSWKSVQRGHGTT